MFQAWQQVQVVNEKLDDHGRAGVVQSATEKDAQVKLDGDSEALSFKPADLRAL